MPRKPFDLEIREELRTPEVRQLLTAYLDLMRFQIRMATAWRERTGEPMRMFDTVVNLEVFLFSDRGGTLQQPIIDSLEVPRTSTRDSLARLVRAGMVIRAGRRYLTSPATLAYVDETGEELLRLLFRLCDAVHAYQDQQGRQPPI